MGDAPLIFFSEAVRRRDELGLSGKLPVLTSPRPARTTASGHVHRALLAWPCCQHGIEGNSSWQLTLDHVLCAVISSTCALPTQKEAVRRGKPSPCKLDFTEETDARFQLVKVSRVTRRPMRCGVGRSTPQFWWSWGTGSDVAGEGRSSAGDCSDAAPLLRSGSEDDCCSSCGGGCGCCSPSPASARSCSEGLRLRDARCAALSASCLNALSASASSSSGLRRDASPPDGACSCGR